MTHLTIQPIQSYNATLKDATDYPPVELCEEAKEGFADWYLRRSPDSIGLSTIQCWINVHYPEHKANDHLLWEIWDGFSEYLADEHLPDDYPSEPCQ